MVKKEHINRGGCVGTPLRNRIRNVDNWKHVGVADIENKIRKKRL